VFSIAPVDFLETAAPFEQAGEIESGTGAACTAYPVGDNQAGFFGTVPDPGRDCLISVGTSGQISLFSTSSQCPESMELRPYLGQGFLHVGAVLCAGKAYETVKDFFRQSAFELGMTDVDDEAVFRMMKRTAEKARTAKSTDKIEKLDIVTAFNGTRSDPGKRGAVQNITLNNLTPGNLALGAIEGIIAELHDFSLELGNLFSPVKRIVTAGSAFRKNYLFGKILEDQFGLETISPEIEDGAALGAALIAAVSAGLISHGRVREIVQQNSNFL
jgi:sedoheptulokinase